MIVPDSSLWVEYLRNTGSTAAQAVDDMLATRRSDLAVCGPIGMELTAGATDDLQHARLDRLINELPMLTFDASLDFNQAADLYRAARRSGRTIRSMIDCLIASVVLRHDAELWHRDADFDVLASITPLRVRSYV